MKILKLFFFIAALLASDLCLSQKEHDGKKFNDEIDTIMRQKLVERLGLDESSADKFVTTYKDNNKQIRMINKERKELFRSIELDPAATDMDSKLDKMLELETKIVDQKKIFFNELRLFLTPQQIAKTMLLRKNFEKKLRKEINNKRRKDKDDKGDKGDKGEK